MSGMPEVWTIDRLREDAVKSAAIFKENRISEPEKLYIDLFVEYFARVRHVMDETDNMLAFSDAVSGLLRDGYYDVIRYIAAPPISEDDMQVVAELSTKNAPSKLALPENASKVRDFVMRTLDIKRFGWVREGRQPTDAELRTALVSTTALLATQQVQTIRRNLAKKNQEGALKAYLARELGYEEVPTRRIDTAFDAPKARQFCGESEVGGKKADVIIGLGDNRFMCTECKVTNSFVNSFKRLNHETVEKAVHWYQAFGTRGVVCAGLLSGVFKPENLMSAQESGVSLFWSHDLEALGEFVRSTYPHRDYAVALMPTDGE